MVERVLRGSEGVTKALEDIVRKMANGGSVSVGFMSGATYPDGTPVAAVAFWNEFGIPERQQPARPFFRRMIAAESPSWPKMLAGALKFADYDGKQAFGIVGNQILGALQKSINDLTSPPLAPSTIAAKGFGKPLIDTSHMINSITFKVDL